VQRGIDAHPVTVSGTFVEVDPARLPYLDDTSIVSYKYSNQSIRAGLRSLPGNPKIGDRLCLEIDDLRPDHARVCGTHGGLDDARQGLIVGSGLLLILMTVIALATVLRRRREEEDLVGAALAGAVPTTPSAGDEAGTTLVLRPALTSRVAMAIVFPACPAVIALAMLTDPTYDDRLVPAALVGAAAVLLVRCLRVTVRCTPDTVAVHGVLFTWRIPTVRVTGVDESMLGTYPVVRWRGPSGRRRGIRLRCFAIDERVGLPFVVEHHRAQMRRLGTWLDAQRNGRGDRARPARSAVEDQPQYAVDQPSLDQ
jgi:hypothetical protein